MDINGDTTVGMKKPRHRPGLQISGLHRDQHFATSGAPIHPLVFGDSIGRRRIPGLSSTFF
jgi:hypothetical protein